MKGKRCATIGCAPPDEECCAPMVETGKIRGISVDSFYLHICRLAANKHHIRSIARILRRPESTVRYRIRKLQQQDLITSYNGTYSTKLYHISSTLTDLFIHNEDLPTLAFFTAHSMSFKFPILEGCQPKSPKGYQTKSWIGYVFRLPDHTIRSTPSNIIVDINQDMGAGSIDDLILKYSQLAQSYAYNFAEKQHLTLGGISRYRAGHFTMEDCALAQLISERGQVCTSSGLHMDKSRSTGDLEMDEQTARSMEFTLNKLPVIAAGLDTRLSGVETSLDSIQELLALKLENQDLKHQNRILEQSLRNTPIPGPESVGPDTKAEI